MHAPPARRPWDVATIVGELVSELRRRDHRLPPGPTGFSVRRSLAFQRDPVGTATDLYEQFGPALTVRVMHRPIVMMLGPQAAHFVAVSGAEHFSWRDGMFGEQLVPLLGDGLITTDGPYHDRARRIMMPALHRKRLDHAVAVMSDEAHRALEPWRPDERVDVYRWSRDLAISIAMRALLGMDPRDGRDLAQAFEDALAYTDTPVWKFPLRGPGSPWSRLQHDRRRLDALINAQIAARRRGAEGDDILSMLLAARDEDGDGFADRELRDQVTTLLFGGHDTSSSTVTFLLYELARHPDVLARIVGELDAVLGGRAPTLGQLTDELPELDLALDETLRRYPPVWFGPRMTVSPFEWDGHHIPGGTHVLYSPWITHHLPDVFADPYAFRPDRFAPDARRAIPKGAYLPFGGGQRICIGKRFGQLVVKSVVTAVLQRHRLEPIAGHVLEIEKTPTLSPAGGLRMIIRPSD